MINSWRELNFYILFCQPQKETHRLSRWFFFNGYNPNGASKRLKGV